MRMHKLLKQPVRGLDETPSTGADVAALYLSQAGKEKTLPAFFTMDRCDPISEYHLSGQMLSIKPHTLVVASEGHHKCFAGFLQSRWTGHTS